MTRSFHPSRSREGLSDCLTQASTPSGNGFRRTRLAVWRISQALLSIDKTFARRARENEYRIMDIVAGNCDLVVDSFHDRQEQG